MAPRVAIVGAGISGLAAAHAVARAHPDAEIVVLERGDRVGGRAHSLHEDGWLVEAGPGGYLDTEASVVQMVRELGLSEQQMQAQAAAARRYIYRAGRLHRLGPGVLAPTPGSLLGPAGVLRALREPFVKPAAPGTEESIRDFCARRLGPRVADRVVRTAMLGIFAGDAGRLSVDACFPQLRQMEQEHGSLIRAGLARRRGRKEGDADNRAEGEGAVKEGGVSATDRAGEAVEPDRPTRKLTSFVQGLQTLPRALAANPRIDLRLGVTVAGLRAEAGTADRPADAPAKSARTRRYRLDIEGGDPIDADAVIVATPVQGAARLFAGFDPELAEPLAQIPVPPVVVVALGFDAETAAQLPTGFGVLVAPEGEVRMLGCLWDSHIYPGRAPEDGFLVRTMFGGRLDPDVADLHDSEILALAATDLETVLGVTAAPTYHRIVRWPAAIPQYEVGHPALRTRVEARLATHPGLFLAGDALEGVAFARTAATGLRQGAAAAEYLRERG